MRVDDIYFVLLPVIGAGVTFCQKGDQTSDTLSLSNTHVATVLSDPKRHILDRNDIFTRMPIYREKNLSRDVGCSELQESKKGQKLVTKDNTTEKSCIRGTKTLK